MKMKLNKAQYIARLPLTTPLPDPLPIQPKKNNLAPTRRRKKKTGFRDELRQAAPGMLVGKMFMEATNSTFINGWNPSNRTTEMTSFVLLQSVSF